MVERDAPLDPPASVGPEVPEADALDQADEVSAVAADDRTDPLPRSRLTDRDFEVPESDALEQAIEVPLDDDWD